MRKHYHLIGIGGLGMSALARILLNKGEKVTGSDLQETSVTRRLRADGAEVYLGHSTKNVKKPRCVVYSTDIPKTNVEYAFAKKKKIPVLHRSEVLAQVLEGYAPILVAGTHGKTTTSALMISVLMRAHLDPSYAVGGYINGISSNGRLGKGAYFVVEADESDGTFVNYPSFGAIITNIEHDHMEFWKNEENLLKEFARFASQVGSEGHLFWCYDDPLLRSLKLKGYSYGFSEQSDLVINNFRQEDWKMYFDLTFKRKHYRNLEIPLIGAHNVLNAAAVFGFGLKLDIDESILRSALKNFLGVGRRVEKVGSTNQIDLFDDYAHHPTEIFATLRAVKSASRGRRVVVAFQPHRYSRTKYCMDDFADAFEYADELIITDIYAASEEPIEGVTAEAIIKKMKGDRVAPACFVAREKLPHYLSDLLRKGDVLITMGAGDITEVGPDLLEKLEKRK